MQIYVENRHDYRLHNPQYSGDNITIELNYLYSDDGVRFFPAHASITLADGEFWKVQLDFEEKLKEIENGNLLG